MFPRLAGRTRLAACGIALVAGVSALAVVVPGLASQADGAKAVDGAGKADVSAVHGDGQLPQRPEPRFASQVVRYTVTEYLDYSVRHSTLPPEVQAAQTKLITERWVQLDEMGNLVRFKDVTRLPSGALWQERLNDDGAEVVNWYNYPGSGAVCGQRGTYHEPPGSSLPFTTDAQLAAAGFVKTDRPSDLALAHPAGEAHSFEWHEDRSPVPGMTSGRAVFVRDQASGQRIADLFFGVAADGHEVLLQSTTFSPVTVVDSPPIDLFRVLVEPAGCGRPDQQATPPAVAPSR